MQDGNIIREGAWSRLANKVEVTMDDNAVPLSMRSVGKKPPTHLTVPNHAASGRLRIHGGKNLRGYSAVFSAVKSKQ